ENYRYNRCNENTNATVFEVYQNRVVQENVQGCGSNQTASEANHSIDPNGSSASILNPVLEFAAQGAGGKYVSVTDPTTLKAELESIIGDIGPTPIAGGGQVAASADGAGAKMYLHTTYYAQKENAAGDRVNWISQIGALFIDDQGRLREDTQSDALGSINGELDPNDLIIRFLPRMQGQAEPRVEKYSGETRVGETYSIDEIDYVWRTTDSFAAPDQRAIHTVIPAAVTANAPTGTDIVTGELIEFNTAFTNANERNRRLLGNNVPADDLISFIKGANPRDEYRSRTLDGTNYLLGNVLTSPVIQGRPNYTYARELNDPDYAAYQERYKDDAKIAYVAANDGLIHAFYADAPSNAAYLASYPGKTVGDELWAYAPFNLLPHLQWLANPRYVHVPYFDGFMRTFDIKAFDDDGVHVGGWGTILVVGTGRGGGAFGLDLDDDGNTDITTRPAYIVLDITERGAPPKLIAEISHNDLGFTTGEPDVARFKAENGTTEWYLVFGSGPRGTSPVASRTAQQNYQVAGIVNDTPDSFTKPNIFAFNLKTSELAITSVTDAENGAFIGGVNSMDWDRDFNDDALYFGTVAGGQDAPSGQLFRALLSAGGTGISITPSVMMDDSDSGLGKPVTNRPLTVIDYRNNYWVFTGTGRFYVRSDGQADNSDNLYVGLKERKSTEADVLLAGGEFSRADLFNTTDVTITNAGIVGNATAKGEGGAALTDIDAVRSELARKEDADGTPTDAWPGWFFTFETNERQHTGTGYLASTLFFSTTVPGSAQQCSAGDKGKVYVIDMRSGVFSPYYQTGTDVSAVKAPLEVEGIGPELNSPADVMNLGDGGVQTAPELDFEGDSQRHSWREISVPW
ncbi:MAG TPA: PilC/PilY family type IV pilus protein, partial [Marinagarivorans sp.]